MNKLLGGFLILLIILASSILNHKLYGKSISTISQYEMAKNFIEENKKRKKSTLLADYMYKRIKSYQKYKNDEYMRLLMLFNMYEYLQEEKNDN